MLDGQLFDERDGRADKTEEEHGEQQPGFGAEPVVQLDASEGKQTDDDRKLNSVASEAAPLFQLDSGLGLELLLEIFWIPGSLRIQRILWRPRRVRHSDVRIVVRGGCQARV